MCEKSLFESRNAVKNNQNYLYQVLFRQPYMLDYSIFAYPISSKILRKIISNNDEKEETIYLPTFLKGLNYIYNVNKYNAEELFYNTLKNYGFIHPKKFYIYHFNDIMQLLNNNKYNFYLHDKYNIKPEELINKPLEIRKHLVEIMANLLGAYIDKANNNKISHEIINVFKSNILRFDPYVANILLEEMLFLISESTLVAIWNSFLRYAKELHFSILQLSKANKKFVNAKKKFVERTGLQDYILLLKLISFVPMLAYRLTYSPVSEDISLALAFIIVFLEDP